MRDLEALLDGRPGTLERHPQDGWTMADPYPLGERTSAALRGIIRAACPPPPAPQLADLEERIALVVRRNMRYFPPLVARGFTLLIHVLDWAPVWRLAARSRLQRLERERAERVLDGLSLSGSPLARLVVMGVRNLVMVGYYDQDEVHAAIGYDPVPWMRARIALRQRLLRGEEPAPADAIGPHSDRLPVAMPASAAPLAAGRGRHADREGLRR